MIRFARWLLMVSALILSGCTTLGLGPDMSTPPQQPARSIDYLNDDVAALVFAFDMPRALQLVQNGTIFTLDITGAGKGARHIKATLVLADGDAIDGSLPPPGDGRTYYLLGFSAKDKVAISDARAWARAQGTDAPKITAAVAPKFCAVSPVDLQATEISILAELPGAPPLTPFADKQPLSAVAASGQSPLPTCAG